MGFFDIGKLMSKVGQGIHKATSLGKKIYDGIGKGLDVAKKVANVASGIPLIGGPIASAAGGVFSTVEGARQGLADILNVGNQVGAALEGVKAPSGPAIPGNVEDVPQAPRSAPTLEQGRTLDGDTVVFDKRRWQQFMRALRAFPGVGEENQRKFLAALRGRVVKDRGAGRLDADEREERDSRERAAVLRERMRALRERLNRQADDLELDPDLTVDV